MSKPPIQMQGLNLAREIAAAQAKVDEAQAKVELAQAQAALAAASAAEAAESATGFSSVEATTVAPGAPATAEIVGPDGARELVLGIPRGLADDASMEAVRSNAASAFATGLAGAINTGVAQGIVGKLDSTKRGQSVIESQRGSALEPWFAALANRDNAPAKWLAIGDSITEGASASANTKRWVQRALDGLRNRFPTAGLTGGGFGHLPPYYDGATMGDPFTGGVGPLGKDTSFGIGRRSRPMGGANTSIHTFTGTSFDVWYVQGPTTGVMGVSIDGGAVTNVNTAGSPLKDGFVWNSGSLAAGSHTVTISVVSGTVYYGGITIYSGDETKGIRLYEAGHFGWKTSDWTTNATYWPDTVATIQPHLVTIALGTNDYQAALPLATYKANLLSIISAVRGKCPLPPAIALVAYPARGDVSSPSIPWSQYVQQLHDIAATDARVSVLDLSARYTSPAVDNTLALWNADKVHPANKGHAMLADTLVGFVSPR